MGYGTMYWPDGKKYTGDFINGKMDGKGILTFPNKDRYDGQFKNDLMHGQGNFYNHQTSNESIEEWRDGKMWTISRKFTSISVGSW